MFCFSDLFMHPDKYNAKIMQQCTVDRAAANITPTLTNWTHCSEWSEAHETSNVNEKVLGLDR